MDNLGHHFVPFNVIKCDIKVELKIDRNIKCAPLLFVFHLSSKSIAYMALDWGEGDIPHGLGFDEAASNNSLNIWNILSWNKKNKIKFDILNIKSYFTYSKITIIYSKNL